MFMYMFTICVPTHMYILLLNKWDDCGLLLLILWWYSHSEDFHIYFSSAKQSKRWEWTTCTLYRCIHVVPYSSSSLVQVFLLLLLLWLHNAGWLSWSPPVSSSKIGRMRVWSMRSQMNSWWSLIVMAKATRWRHEHNVTYCTLCRYILQCVVGGSW